LGLPPPFSWLHKGDPETSRHALREGLLAALGPRARVTFQCGVSDVRPNGNGGATFFDADDNVLGNYDLAIDASGVASPLRKRRVPGTEIKEWYTGITTLGGIIQDPETELDPEIVRKLGQGTLSVMGDRHDGNGSMSLWLQRFGATAEDHRAAFGLYLVRKGMTDLCEELGIPPSNRAISETDRKETVEKIKLWVKKEMGDKWDPMYKQCVDRVTEVNIRPLFLFDPKVLPISSDLPFTCVGDALHALPPFTGSGGNLALCDAGELATFLVQYALGKEKRELVAGLRIVELKCFERAAKVAEWGESTRQAIIRTCNLKNISQSYSVAVMIKGEGWTKLKRLFYLVVIFYMWLHKLGNYGMPRRPK
jgi:2-polyprenyl-6-methoxyphenol hydroxylase-like FAD-dependent oxidoreductase